MNSALQDNGFLPIGCLAIENYAKPSEDVKQALEEIAKYRAFVDETTRELLDIVDILATKGVNIARLESMSRGEILADSIQEDIVSQTKSPAKTRFITA